MNLSNIVYSWKRKSYFPSLSSKLFAFNLVFCYWLSTSLVAALPHDNAALYHHSAVSSLAARGNDAPSGDGVPLVENSRSKKNTFYVPLKGKNRFSMIEYKPKNINPNDTPDNPNAHLVSAIYSGFQWNTTRMFKKGPMQKLGTYDEVVVKIPVQKDGSLLWQALRNSQDGYKFIMDVLLAREEEDCDFVYRAIMPQFDSDLLKIMGNRALERSSLIVMFYALLNQVEYMHDRKVYHRDLKIDNVFVNLKGNTKAQKEKLKKFVEVRIGDFDSATREETMDDYLGGTLMYMSQGKQYPNPEFSL